ncbi:MAG: PKD domain-containing protein [Thermoplasmata archaeon]|nr:MAG: PKD domain-containing protein [Thermoplasmata archaeon]
MKDWLRIKIIFYIFVLFFATINPFSIQLAKADNFDGLSWVKYADENGAIPVVDIGNPGDMDHPWVLSAGVLRDDDVLFDNDTTNDCELYKMWYSGNMIGQYYTFRIFYATSLDGIRWNKYVDDSNSAIPVIDLGSAPGGADDASAYAPCVLKEGGLYKMWYSGQQHTTSSYKTLYTTSTDGINWTKYGVVLDVGAPGERDERDAYAPEVIIDDNAPSTERYKMWYTGQTQSGPLKIFYAISSDGVNWMKYRDADGAIPVLEPGGAPGGLDDNAVAHQCLVKDNDGSYRMWYNGVSNIGQKILYANSSDGIKWQKYGLAIDVGNPGELDDNSIGAPIVLIDDNETYEMWYSGADGDYVRNFYAYSASPKNIPPVADAGPDQVAYEYDEVKFNGSNSYDLDGDIVIYKWDFNASDGLWWETGAPPDAVGLTPTHIYNNYGVYIVTLNVTDNNVSWDLDTCEIIVLVHPPLPPTPYINVSKNNKDVVLYWEPPVKPGIEYYL